MTYVGLLKSLRWLQVECRIQCKLLLLAIKLLHVLALLYLSELRRLGFVRDINLFNTSDRMVMFVGIFGWLCCLSVCQSVEIFKE